MSCKVLLRKFVCLLAFVLLLGNAHLSNATDVQYVYDNLNRLVEVHYLDKVIRYTYDDAGNRIGMTVETLVAAPLVLSINPPAAVVGGSGFALNVTGNNFNSASVVQWNGSTRPTSYINPNQLTATISTSDLESLGTATVSVLNSSADIISNAAFFTVQSGAGCVPVSISNSLTMPTTATASIPVTVSDLSGKGIGAFDFVVSYNSAVIQPVVGNPTDTVGTLSSGSTLTVDTSVPGQLRVGGFRLSQYAGAGTLIKLNFQAVGAIGTSSALTFGQFRFNESDPCTTVSNGNITIAANNQISGTVSYGIVGTQGLKRVQNVIFNATGTPSAAGQSDSLGSYAINGLANGPYTVSPSKTGDVNGITAGDATLVLRFVAAGGGTLSPNQQIAADTNRNGIVTAGDATQILRFIAAGGPTAQTGFAGVWRFNPSTRNYAPLSSSISNEDYDAILSGEVSGNWTPPGSIAEPSTEETETDKPATQNLTAPVTQSSVESSNQGTVSRGVQIAVPLNSNAGNGATITIPVTLTNNSNKGISGYSFAVMFDPLVLQPVDLAASTTGTLSSTFNHVADANTPGRLGIAAAGGNNVVAGPGTLVNLRFTVVGQHPMTSALTFNNVLFEDDQDNTIPSAPTGGTFLVAGTTAATVNVSGRILTADGRSIGNVIVTMTSPTGEIRTARSSPMGYYQFQDVAAGQTYSFTVRSKQHSFSTPTVIRTVIDNIAEFDFVAEP